MVDVKAVVLTVARSVSVTPAAGAENVCPFTVWVLLAQLYANTELPVVSTFVSALIVAAGPQTIGAAGAALQARNSPADAKAKTNRAATTCPRITSRRGTMRKVIP